MDTKHQFAQGTSLQQPTRPLSSMGAHTDAPNRAATPAATGSLTNAGRGAAPLGGAR